MLNGKHKQVSNSFITGAILAVVGGFFDAYTYVVRGKVFANAQTGNIVLFGINLVNKNFHKATVYLVPILAFVVGVLIVEKIKADHQSDKVHWRQVVVLAETAIVAFVAFIPEGEANMLANILISLVCAMQTESFRKFEGYPTATTMCTGNLRSGTERLYRFFATGNHDEKKIAFRYYAIIILFIIGAGVGAVLSEIFMEKAVLVCAVALFGVFLMMNIKPED